MNLLPVAFRPSTNAMLYTGALIPESINILKDCDNIEKKCKAVAHI